MICPKCQEENEEGSVFCSRCGARLDGKKECPSCGKQIRDDAVYCNFCGARVDGKQVCKSCGTVYDGSFCPACGTPNGKQTFTSLKSSGRDLPKKMAKILSLVAACLLFLSSFLIGYRFVLTDTAEKLLGSTVGESGIATVKDTLKSETDRPSAIHYIVREIRRISDAADEYPSKPNSIERGSFATLAVGSAVGILILLANMTVAVVCFAKTLSRILGGEEVTDAVGLCIPSFITSLFALAVIFAQSGTTSFEAYPTYTRAVPSALFLLCYLPAVCAFVGAFVFAMIGDGAYRNRFSSVLTSAGGAVGAVLSGLLLHFAVGDIIVKVQSEATIFGSTKERIPVSSATLFHDIFSYASRYTKSAALTRAVVLSDICYALTLISMILATVVCVQLLVGLFLPGKKRISLASVILSGVMLFFGIVKAVCDALLAGATEGYLADNISLSAAPIAFVLLAFLLFGGLLTVRMMKREDCDFTF